MEGNSTFSNVSRTRASPSDCLVSYQIHSLVGGTLNPLQWAYFTASADRVLDIESSFFELE